MIRKMFLLAVALSAAAYSIVRYKRQRIIATRTKTDTINRNVDAIDAEFTEADEVDDNVQPLH